jgi:hypothetical protein
MPRPRIRIGDGLSMPIDALTQRFAFLARTGAGKSYAAGDLAEEFLEARQQIVVADPQGAWWGLRSSADGKGPGYAILIMGGSHGDVPLEPTAGALVADLVTGEGISVILDMSDFETDAEEARFMSAFADRLFRKNRHPLHFFVDEADTFAPQSPMREENLMLNRMARLAKRGRSKGIGMSLISQRSAAISKRVLSQTEVMVAMQTTDPRDRKAIGDWTVGKGSDEDQKKVLSSLAALKVGEAWVWSPSFLSILKRVRMRVKRTFDSSATPKVGAKRRTAKVLAQVDLQKLRERMATTIERAKQEDPAALREELAKVKKELGAAKTLRPSAPAKPVPPVVREKEVRTHVLSKQDIRRLQDTVHWMKKVSHRFKSVGTLGAQLDADAGAITKSLDAATKAIEKETAEKSLRPGVLHMVPPAVVDKAVRKMGSTGTGDSARRAAMAESRPRAKDNGDLKEGHLRMLRALAQCHPVRRTMAQIATLANYTASGGTFGTNFTHLVKEEYLSQDRSLYGLTEKGIDASGESIPKEPQNAAERIRMWTNALNEREGKMLAYLVQKFPETVTREELGQAVNLAHTGGTFGTALSTLKTNDLAEIKKNDLRASRSLFTEGRAHA